MAYLVVAYPELESVDFDFIQKYRADHDPRYYNLIGPHITLVFSIHDIGKEDFIDEIRKQTQGINSFKFTIKSATINLDDSGDYYHEFLVFDEGNSNIIKLHDRLYSGALSSYLRYDIDFIAHIGIGNSETVTESKARVDDLNHKTLEIHGKVTNVDIIEYSNDVITTIEKIELGIIK